jgi:hypothetical protein
LAQPRLRATGYGILNLGGTVASGLTTLSAGLLKSSIGIGGCFEVAALILLAAALLLWRIKLPTESPS